MEKEIYAIRIYGGVWEDKWEQILFTSFDKLKVQTYVDKYNRILERLQRFYSFKVGAYLDRKVLWDDNIEVWTDKLQQLEDIVAAEFITLKYRE